MRDYYIHQPSLGERLRCIIRFLLFLGHDFEVMYTEMKRPVRYGDRVIDTPCGEMALVCRLCERVHNRRDWQGFRPEISYGSSPSAGRILDRRAVHHLPIAPDGLEPLCGAAPPTGLPIPHRVRCRKFAYHVRSDDRSRRAHDGGFPVPGGRQSFIWDDPKGGTS